MPHTAAGYLPVVGLYHATIRLGAKLALVTGWVLHVDLDQFLAAVEVLRRPELRGKPVVVGPASDGPRQLGVHSGQPLRPAARRCPAAVFHPVNRATYDAAPAFVMA